MADDDKSTGLAASAAAAASRAASAVSSAASAAAAAVSGAKAEPAAAAPAAKVPVKTVSQVAWENLLLTPLPPLFQGGMGSSAISAASDVEASMVATDVYQKELGEARNALEAYVYDMRVRVDAGGDLASFGTQKAREALMTDLNAAEEWIDLLGGRGGGEQERVCGPSRRASVGHERDAVPEKGVGQPAADGWSAARYGRPLPCCCRRGRLGPRWGR